MRWIGCVRCEKFRCDFMVQTCALIAPVQHIFTEFHVATKDCQMHPNTMKHTKIGVYGPIGWIGCVRCEKFRCNFVARTFVLIALVPPVLYRASSSNETIPNISKDEFRAKYVDWVHSLRKILMRLRGMNFCTNCTSLTRSAPSFVQ